MDRLLDHPWRLLACVVLLASCATTTKVDTLGAARAASESDCEITFFKDAKPSAPFEVLGKIESHIARNFFFGGKARLEDEGYEELRAKACGIGGNAVVIDDHLQTSVSEMTHVHVWATVIRLPAKK
jgi:hypothetical protein